MKAAVIIPAYNEAATVAKVAQHALRHVPWVVVIDDGSSDGTAQALAGLPLEVLHNDRNRGKAASLHRGQQHALAGGAEAVITMDADGQHRPEDIPRLLAAARANPHSLVIGARVINREAMPALRNFGNRVGDFWISWAAGQPLKDSQSGFRVYPADLLRLLNLKTTRTWGFVFESAALIDGVRKGYGVEHVPIETLYFEGSRTSHFRPALDTFRIVVMVTWKIVSRAGYPQGLLRSLGLLKPRALLTPPLDAAPPQGRGS